MSICSKRDGISLLFKCAPVVMYRIIRVCNSPDPVNLNRENPREPFQPVFRRSSPDPVGLSAVPACNRSMGVDEWAYIFIYCFLCACI